MAALEHDVGWGSSKTAGTEKASVQLAAEYRPSLHRGYADTAHMAQNQIYAESQETPRIR